MINLTSNFESFDFQVPQLINEFYSFDEHSENFISFSLKLLEIKF